jgi:hypothetical protein
VSSKKTDKELLIGSFVDDLGDEEGRVIFERLKNRYDPRAEEIAEYDQEALRLRNRQQEALLAWVCERYPRNERDGDSMGVYMTKQRGHQCAWSVKWSSKTYGLISPSNLRMLEACTVNDLVVEASDIAARAKGDNAVHAEIAETLLRFQSAGGLGGFKKILPLLRTAREVYPEFNLRGDMPDSRRIFCISPRPSWDTAEHLKQEVYSHE